VTFLQIGRYSDISLRVSNHRQADKEACVMVCRILMGKMNVVISDETETRFREAVAYHKGMKKGNISKALEEAINLWLDSRSSSIRPRYKRL
jgi:hypothetical protein